MYRGLGAPVATGSWTSNDPIAITIDPNAENIVLGPELTAGPYIPPPNSGTATALLRASIAANAPGASDVLSYGTLSDKVALIPNWGWIAAGVGVFALAFMGGGRRR